MTDVEHTLIHYIAKRIAEIVPEGSYGAIVSRRDDISSNISSIINSNFGRYCTAVRIKDAIKMIDEDESLKFVVICAKSINDRQRKALIKRGLRDEKLWVFHYKESTVVLLGPGTKNFAISFNIEIIEPVKSNLSDSDFAERQEVLASIKRDFVSIYNETAAV